MALRIVNSMKLSIQVLHIVKNDLLIVGEPKLRIMQKHTKIAPERYTAKFLYMECLNTG